MKEQKSQTKIMMYSHKVTQSVPISSTSLYTPSTSATLETAGPIPPLYPPPQMTQYGNSDDEDLYDDLIPLN